MVEIVTSAALATAAAFAVLPGWMRANERTHLAKASSEIQRTAIGLGAHYVDHGAYPPCGVAEGRAGRAEVAEERRPAAAGVTTANSFAPESAGARRLVTFRLPDRGRGEDFSTLTTPVAYLDRLPVDPFAYTEGASPGYFLATEGSGWIVWSLAPDRDENAAGGPGDIGRSVESLCDVNTAFPYMWQASPALIGVTYDPSNGTFSNGDLWRIGGKGAPGTGRPATGRRP